jgi:hypothetical protein
MMVISLFAQIRTHRPDPPPSGMSEPGPQGTRHLVEYPAERVVRGAALEQRRRERQYLGTHRVLLKRHARLKKPSASGCRNQHVLGPLVVEHHLWSAADAAESETQR